MRTPSSVALAGLLAVLVLAGCATPAAQSPQSASRISPLAKTAEEGTLVVAVLGYPRDIEYSVNGVRIRTDEPIPWWVDARLTLRLESGTYRIEGGYRVRGWTGDKSNARVLTPEPVPVRAGATTYLLADLAKDWRGVPAENTTDLRVVDAETFERLIAAQRQSRTASQGEPAATTSSSAAAAVPEAAPASGATSIVIRGNEVVPPGTAAETSTAALPQTATVATAPSTAVPQPAAAESSVAAGLPSAAAPESQVLLAPGASAPPTLAVHLESEPAGARVYVDDHEVGTTPIEVRIEPQLDHVIRFERDGCSEHVRFLSASGWEKGRSTRLVAKLECP